jgi:hypothetical protein
MMSFGLQYRRKIMELTSDRDKLKALQLIAGLIKPEEKFNYEGLDNQEILLEATDIALSNKIFFPFYEELIKVQREIPEYISKIANEKLKRKKLYDEALIEIIETSSRKDVKFMIFKTIKPFTYIGDDIDIFLPSTELRFFISLLEKHGYHLLGHGPGETTLGKRVLDEHIVIDIHKDFSASFIPYVDKNRVWLEKREINFDGHKIYVPSLLNELLIIASHSVLKEFQINLADFFYTLFLSKEINWRKLYLLAHTENMYYTLIIFLGAIKNIYELLYCHQPSFSNLPLNDTSLPIILKASNRILRNDIFRVAYMPYRYRVNLPAIAYIDKFRGELLSGHGNDPLTFLLNILRAPFTSKEGISILWKYMKSSVNNML